MTVDHKLVLVVRQRDMPPTFLVHLMEGAPIGLDERAKALINAVVELEISEQRSFQLLPFSFDQRGHLESVLAVGNIYESNNHNHGHNHGR